MNHLEEKKGIELIPLIDAEMSVRFWSKVEPQKQGCWTWTGSKSGDGYGEFRLPKRQKGAAHRIAFALAHRVEPRTLHVCHSCDNPLCCNPDHLFLGTAQINAWDKSRKGRGRGRFSAKVQFEPPAPVQIQEGVYQK